MTSKLYNLSVICPRCGTGHLEMPGEYGRCRKCWGPLKPGEPDYEAAIASLAREQGRPVHSVAEVEGGQR